MLKTCGVHGGEAKSGDFPSLSNTSPFGMTFAYAV
jgi:hypothetical protein